MSYRVSEIIIPIHDHQASSCIGTIDLGIRNNTRIERSLYCRRGVPSVADFRVSREYVPGYIVIPTKLWVISTSLMNGDVNGLDLTSGSMQ